MRLLLTRAVEDATRTRERLEVLGHRVIISPMLEMVGTGAAWPSGVVDAVIATSGQAFAVPISALSNEIRRVVPLYLVGARTSDMARCHGFLGKALVAKNAASLVIAFGKGGSRHRRLVYLAGCDRKPDIETALDVIGRAVDVIEVYEARAVPSLSLEAAKALRYGAIDGVLHFSRRSANLFASAAATVGLDVSRATHFCLSEDVAAPLREAGCATIHVAETPTEQDLLVLVSGAVAEPGVQA